MYQSMALMAVYPLALITANNRLTANGWAEDVHPQGVITTRMKNITIKNISPAMVRTP